MSWKVVERAFSMSFGMPYGPRVFPLDMLLRHMSYVILVN